MDRAAHSGSSEVLDPVPRSRRPLDPADEEKPVRPEEAITTPRPRGRPPIVLVLWGMFRALEDPAEATRRAIKAYLVGLLISIAVALIVILTAINTQSGRIPDAEGHGWAFNTLFGPDFGSGLNKQGWTVLTTQGEITGEGMTTLITLLNAHLRVDTAFIAVYTLLLALTVHVVCNGWWRRIGLIGVAALFVADLMENAFAYRIFSANGPIDPVLIFTTLKWILIATVLAILLLAMIIPGHSTDESSPRRRFGRGVRALVHQRFSYVPVAVIFILSIPSGAAILEQLPDVQRRWVFDGSVGLRHSLAAMISTVALSLFLLAVGRRRTVFALSHLRRNGTQPTMADAAPSQRHATPSEQRRVHAMTSAIRDESAYAVWAVGPAVALLGFVVIVAAGRDDLILKYRFLIFLAVPLLLIIGGSAITRRAWDSKRAKDHGWDRPYSPLQFSLEEAFAIGIAGTIAGVAAVVVGGLSLLRAFTPLVVLPASTYVSSNVESAHVRPLIMALLVISAVAVIIPWLLMIFLARTLGGPTRKTLDRRLQNRSLRFLWQRRDWLLLFVSVAVYLLLGLVPQFAAWIGLSATATLAIGSLFGIVSAAALVLQERPTGEIFRLVRFRRTPLVTVLVLTIVLTSVFGGRGGIHGVDPGTPPPVSTADTRPTMQEAFNQWYLNAAKCQIAFDGYKVRPMLLVAAEGGGIRASYWTVRGLQAIDDATCGEYSTFFSGGASGGSVGLTVARFSGSSDDPGSRAAVDAVKEMARPEILSRAADGTFVRDLLYGASGVPVPRIGENDGWAWHDRARLIEEGWAGSSGWGEHRFLSPTSALSPATGQLILNSTSVKDNCRVWIAQIQLPEIPGDPTPSFDPEKSCDKNPSAATRTIDLFRAYGPYTNDGRDPSCLGLISAATAALLTARFPYVTPSGVIGPCPNLRVVAGERVAPYWPETQLVDGGYIENSGLATITDLSDQWLGLVRENNRQALAGNKPALVVPIIVFLTNGDRNVTQPALGASPVSEFVVPPATFLRSGSALDNNDAQLGRAQDAVALEGFCSQTLDQPACQALQRRFPSRVVVVDRVTQPEIGAPLGWVLSGASITSLDKAMIAQLDTKCPENVPEAQNPGAGGSSKATNGQVICRAGFATLGDLARYFNWKKPA